ncbi:uncharacterized protein B0T15DRAFT_534268 [Chaetomium strumarium]|uniref:Uncharacterized protein n=1 Tax=Chaetomium strumarium TaxID=1170767 RepID=A0AAJ0M296_9PEZI|nr:hypothetical protein B0T15DRAFT_534268 [Chaetomium strumarium]
MVLTQRARLLRLLAIAQFPLAVDASLYDGFGGYGQGQRVAPYDANSTAFLDAVAASNSTGVFKIPGYDVSKPFPGTPIDGWTLSMAALDMSHAAVVDATHEPMVGYSLTIQAPDSLIKNAGDGTKFVNADPSWGMCMWIFSPPPSNNKTLWNNPTNKPLADDGSCKGFLSDECIAALEKHATWEAYPADPAKLGSNGQFGSLVGCNTMHFPDECGPNGPGNSLFNAASLNGVPVPFLNGSITRSDGWQFEDYRGSSYNSTEDLQLYWDSQVLNFWTVVTVMVNATVDANAQMGDKGVGLPGVSCVAPNGVGTGKAFAFSTSNFTVPNGNGDNGNGTKADDENSGVGMAVPAWSVLWSVLALLV